jgi:hypothetical protein
MPNVHLELTLNFRWKMESDQDQNWTFYRSWY